MSRNKPKGFGPEDQGKFVLNKYSLGHATLSLAALNAVRDDDGEVDTENLPDGTIVWGVSEDWLTVDVQATAEDWLIELTQCNCCDAIKAAEIKVYRDTDQGVFFKYDMNDWEGIEPVISHARQLSQAVEFGAY